MWRLRLTLFSDRPDCQKLAELSDESYRLFRHKASGVYLLDTPMEDYPEIPLLSAYYDPVIAPYKHFDLSEINTLKSEHPEIEFEDIHEDIIDEALSLSETFKTRVLSAYGDDEGSDFVAVAENGYLVRLKFKAGTAQGRRVPKERLGGKDSEIDAVRVGIDEKIDDIPVHEFTYYDAEQNGNAAIKLIPFWTYWDGEINGEVFFHTVKTTVPDPRLIFRNAMSEFERAFGHPSPDFTDIRSGDYQLVEQVLLPETIGQSAKKWKNFGVDVASLTTTFLFAKKRLKYTLPILAFLLYALFMRTETETTSPPHTFSSHCQVAGGALASKNTCQVSGVTYSSLTLPGEKGEARRIAAIVSGKRVPCTNDAQGFCLLINGELFSGHIEGFSHKPNKLQAIIIERTQNCEINADCTEDKPIFSYKFLHTALETE